MRNRGNWMQTASGRAYWPTAPRPEDVAIDDIAHALSNLCRYGGHCRKFYSVAEHSVHVSRIVPREHALVALLHDATEAYCVDVPRPLKAALPDYQAVEALNWEAIATHFGLELEMPACVKEADTAMLLAEQRALMGPTPEGLVWAAGSEGLAVPDVEIECWPPTVARQEFVHRFCNLLARLA